MRYCSCLPQSATSRKKRLERNRNRTDLLNSFAKFSPASVHAELLEVCPPTSPSVRDILSKSTRRATCRGAISRAQGRAGRVVVRRYQWIYGYQYIIGNRCLKKAYQPDLYKSGRHHSKEQRRRPEIRGRRHARAVSSRPVTDRSKQACDEGVLMQRTDALAAANAPWNSPKRTVESIKSRRTACPLCSDALRDRLRVLRPV